MRLLCAAALATTILTPAPLAPANFTTRDVAVIEAALRVVFPKGTLQPVVLNETQAYRIGSDPPRYPLSREFDTRNQYRRAVSSLGSYTIIDAAKIVQGDSVMVTFPGFSADGKSAIEVLNVRHPDMDGVHGTFAIILLRNENGSWRLSRRWTEPGWFSRLPHRGPFRVGGDVKAPIVVRRVEAVMTPEAEEHHITGIVIVEMLVDDHGHVHDLRILKDLPYGLGAAATAAIKKWELRPGTLSGRPVPVIDTVTVSFPPPSER